ncbi:MAG: hypothetical protein QM763_09485 [Agriterribacter sp.]
MANNYEKEISSLYNQYAKPFTADIMEQLGVQFALVSANLSNFLPTIPVTDHERFYRNILLHQQLSLMDEIMPADAMQHIIIENESGFNFSLLKQAPAIFCTIHLGSYRLINYFLKKNYIPFALVANRNIILKESERFNRNFEKYHVENGHSLQIIDAEESTSAIKMIRALKQGVSLLIYMDGNTGAGIPANQNLCTIDFLAQQLAVRSGIAYMSIKTKTPIIPLVSYRTDRFANNLRFLPSVLSSFEIVDEKAAIQRTMQQLYNQISQAIIKYPYQWEAWLYLHKSAKITPANYANINKSNNDTSQIAFNSHEFAIFKINTRSFLLQKNTYSSCLIDEALFDFLSSCLPFHLGDITIAPGLLTTLFNKRIIIPADSNICSSLK